MTKTRIAASLMAADGARLADAMTALAMGGVDGWHWDVMDGHFVPNLTFGPDTVKACRAVSDLEFDVHLMVTDPAKWIVPFADAGADCIDVHVETKNSVRDLVAQIKKAGCRAGLVLNPDTSLDVVTDEWASQIDRLLLMSVVPGFGGQSFIDISDKIKQARQKFPSLDIAVDGGINVKTAPIARSAGATTLISGSGLLSAQAPFATRVNELRGGAA